VTAIGAGSAAPGWRRLPEISPLAWRVWQRNRDVYMNIWRAEAIWPIVDPAITLVALGIGLGDFVELDFEGSYLEFIAPGLLAVFPMWFAAGETGWGSFFKLENQRTFDAIISTPASVDDVTTGEILWAATRAVMSVVYILVLLVAFGAVGSVLALLAIPFALLPGLMFASISLCYTAITRSISQLNYFFAAYITPQFWLAGVFFPLDALPVWVQTIAWFTPAYHTVEIYRGLVAGDPDAGDLVHLAWIVVVAAVFYVLAAALMRRRLVR
jgi:lipooligosaccharide transport system permease protein